MSIAKNDFEGVLEDIRSTLASANIFELVSLYPPSMDVDELLDRVERDNLPAAFVVEPPGDIEQGIETSGTGVSPSNHYGMVWPFSIIGVDDFDSSVQTPTGIFHALHRKVWDALLDDRSRGGRVHDTIPGPPWHSGHAYDDRIVYAIRGFCPSEWRHN